MNPGIGAPELLVIVILALIVVGGKDLPLMVRRIGKMVGQVRATAREFQRSFDELGREAELQELRKEIDQLKGANPMTALKREMAETEADIRSAVEDRPHPRLKTASAAKPAPAKDAAPAPASEPENGAG